MAAWHVWLKSLGAAIWEEAPKAILGLIPFGENVGRIGENWWKKLREAQPPAQDRAALEGLVNADPQEVAAAAQKVAEEVAPPEARHALALTLQLAAPASRRVLARADDSSGKTVPQALRLDGPLILGRFVPPAPPRFETGADFQGWKLTERLGAGGMAEVWKACHPHDDELVAAVKFFTGDEARGRLGQHEVSVLKQVRKLGAGRGVVQLLDFNVLADPPWIKFEYVGGGDLLRHAPAYFGLKATALVQKLARIVGACHRLTPPVVHRDIKPGNILMMDGEPLIADFGIGGVSAALAQERPTTRPTAALPTMLTGSHTSLYASPQQMAGEGADPRDDVYALGVLWWQLATADLASGAPSGMWPEELKEIGYGDALVRVLGACVEPKKIDKRPRDAAELAERIAAAMGQHAVEQTPVSKPIVEPLKPASLPAQFTCTALNAPMVLVPPGRFWIGGSDGVCGGRHVVMDRPFYLATHPVTQGQWKAVMGSNPSACKKKRGIGDIEQFPVESVSWDDIQEYLAELNAMVQQGAGWLYRLPTEEEWEYAARSPVPSPAGIADQAHCGFSFYTPKPTNDLSDKEANFDGQNPAGKGAVGRFLNHPTQVGAYPANGLGIHDMHGNVWEWTQTVDGKGRVIRGGSWYDDGFICTAAYRGSDAPETRSHNIGFRLARVMA